MEPRLKFGFYLLAVLFVLALTFGLGHVAEASSFGLGGITAALGSLATFWGQWAFKHKEDKDQEQ